MQRVMQSKIVGRNVQGFSYISDSGIPVWHSIAYADASDTENVHHELVDHVVSTPAGLLEMWGKSRVCTPAGVFFDNGCK